MLARVADIQLGPGSLVLVSLGVAIALFVGNFTNTHGKVNLMAM